MSKDSENNELPDEIKNEFIRQAAAEVYLEENDPNKKITYIQFINTFSNEINSTKPKEIVKIPAQGLEKHFVELNQAVSSKNQDEITKQLAFIVNDAHTILNEGTFSNDKSRQDFVHFLEKSVMSVTGQDFALPKPLEAGENDKAVPAIDGYRKFQQDTYTQDLRGLAFTEKEKAYNNKGMDCDGIEKMHTMQDVHDEINFQIPINNLIALKDIDVISIGSDHKKEFIRMLDKMEQELENASKKAGSNDKSKINKIKAGIIVEHTGKMQGFLKSIEDSKNKGAVKKVLNVVAAAAKVAIMLGLSQNAKREFRTAKNILRQNTDVRKSTPFTAAKELGAKVKDSNTKAQKLGESTRASRSQKEPGINTKPARKGGRSR